MVKNHAGFQDLNTLQTEILEFLDSLPTHEHGEWIARSFATLLRIAKSDVERLDWKILTYAMQDMEQGFETFYPYRHVRKITIFGSARTPRDRPEYDLAVRFARRMTEYGFMIITGAGGGIMKAGNEGATAENSFGLNIQLPFEQASNPFIEGDPKSIYFKYFFTRKLFFLKESDALALFPGGFGTQDEAFESLTLSQTGKYGPAPIVLIDRPGGHYWKDWNEYIQRQLLARGLISTNDSSLYTITDNLDVACEAIRSFYRVYHSSRYVGEKLTIRLKCELSDENVEYLNANFSDLLIEGRIEKSQAFPQELNDETIDLPRLALYFNQRDLGRLYQLIATINELGCQNLGSEHPEQK